MPWKGVVARNYCQIFRIQLPIELASSRGGARRRGVPVCGSEVAWQLAWHQRLNAIERIAYSSLLLLKWPYTVQADPEAMPPLPTIIPAYCTLDRDAGVACDGTVGTTQHWTPEPRARVGPEARGSTTVCSKSSRKARESHTDCY